MSLERKSKRVALTALLVAVGVVSGVGPAHRPNDSVVLGITWLASAEARDVSFKNTQVAYDQGLSAYRTGDYNIAAPAFEFVIGRNDPNNRIFAEYYLGRLFADNAGTHTDHTKAYILFQRIADEHADIDPDDARKAPFVAKALTAVALYVRDGLPEFGLKPDRERAIEYLRHAATFFNEPDAQYELAKILIGDEAERQTGLHFLQKLVRESHAAAQATFADMLARGRYVKQDHAQALGLIRMAVENAAHSDRIWIDDIYQQIYCGSNGDAREKSKGLVAQWRRLFVQPRSNVEQPMALGRRAEGAPTRVCSNGERLDIPRGAAQAAPSMAATPPAPSGMPIANGLMPSGAREPSPAMGLAPGGRQPPR